MLLEEVERGEAQLKAALDRNNRPLTGRMEFPEGFSLPE
jgi:hypothetical protein